MKYFAIILTIFLFPNIINSQINQTVDYGYEQFRLGMTNDKIQQIIKQNYSSYKYYIGRKKIGNKIINSSLNLKKDNMLIELYFTEQIKGRLSHILIYYTYDQGILYEHSQLWGILNKKYGYSQIKLVDLGGKVFDRETQWKIGNFELELSTILSMNWILLSYKDLNLDAISNLNWNKIVNDTTQSESNRY